MDTMTFNQLVDTAKQLVENRRVLNVSKYATSRVYFCEIFDKKHVFEVYLDEDAFEDDLCSCQTFKQQKICEHVLAAELYLSAKGIHRNKGYSQEVERNDNPLLQSFRQLSYQLPIITDNMNDSIIIDISVIIHPTYYQGETDIEIHLKAGKEKLYVIQHPAMFVTAYFDKLTYQLGKHEIIDWQYDTLTKEQHQNMLFLKDAVFNQDLAAKYSYANKSVIVHRLLFNRLFQLILNHPSIHVYLAHKKGMLPLTVKKMLTEVLQVTLTQENKLDVTVDSCIHLIDKASGFAIIDTSIVKINEEQQNILLSLRENTKVTLDSLDEQQNFYLYVLPRLQQVATINGYDNTLEQTLILQMDYVNSSVTITILNDRLVPLHAIYTSEFLNIMTAYHLKDHGDFTFTNSFVLLKEAMMLLNDLKKIAQVTTNDSFDTFTLESPITMSLEQLNGYFEINFSIDTIDNRDMQRILEHIQKQEAFYQFHDGRVLALQDDYLQPLHDTLATIKGQYRFKKGKLQLNTVQAISVSHSIDTLQTPQDIQLLIEYLKDPNRFEVSLPNTLQNILKPYQITGFKWLKMLKHYQLGGILADDMGLGKTVQTIAFLLSEWEENQLTVDKPTLIIAPTSLVLNWQKEFQQFAPQLTITVVSGNKSQRKRFVEEEKGQVIITSYHSFRQDVAKWSDVNWHSVILDESQMVKNPNTKTHQALRQLQTLTKFALSGTPIENKKEELWSVFSLVLPSLLPSLKSYQHMESHDIVKTVQPFMLRRTKDNVLHELPSITEKILYNELTQSQKTLYVTYLQQIQNEVSSYSNEQLTRQKFQILTALTRLRQICNHPQLFLSDYEGDSGKLEQFLEQVHRAITNGHRLLVFSQFASMLDILQLELQKHGVTSFLLNGKTPPQTRQDMVERFNAGENNVFLISLKAGGTGLNLTSADTIILYDLWWNPAVEEQAKSRAHRIGQKNPVQVYRMVSSGTIEEKIIKLQEKKKALFDEMIDAQVSGHSNHQTLTNEDIKEILGI